jgi:Probable cobalt transporter subunit (CbtB)
MTTPAASPPAEAVGVARVPTWVLLAVLAVAAAVIWLVGFDNGQASAAVDSTGTFLHEFFHDARHVSGAPCH